MIDTPFESSESWVAYLSAAEIPVLRHTAEALNGVREQAETANGRVLSALILKDPLMTLRVLNFIESRRRLRQSTDITTIERALMMAGIGPFFDEIDGAPLIEDTLKNHPQALLGLLKVIGRARRASHWAREWAVFRHDLDVDEITVATLLRYDAEMLMWCFAPTLALKVKHAQEADRTLRTSIAQKDVYGLTLNELGLALAHAWHLPQLITTLLDPSQANDPRVRNVALACDLARHSANGWNDAALPDDYTAICELLHINQETLMRKLGLDAQGQPIKT
ncbi:MAG: HDOD domain-containing protein [Rhodocyclaceae bacterium]|jgi:HD-like signal output (HDOD) protein|nr:HDOD domain-containing protein [Rhodocyclaceae bacterium]